MIASDVSVTANFSSVSEKIKVITESEMAEIITRMHRGILTRLIFVPSIANTMIVNQSSATAKKIITNTVFSFKSPTSSVTNNEVAEK